MAASAAIVDPWAMRQLGILIGLISLAAACGSSESKIEVQFVQPTPTPVATLGQPTPTPEPVEIIVSTELAFQGGAILVSVTGPAESGSILFRGREYQLIQGDHSIYAFVGVSSTDTPGTTHLNVDFVLDNGSAGQYVADVAVAATDWTVDEVVFTPEQLALREPEVLQQENDALDAIYAVTTTEKLWSELWQFPVLGGITAPFGEQRSVNGEEPSGHHSGADFGAELGTEVLATNSGTIAFAGQLQIRGNAVIVDHGGGLFSTYAHLSSMEVTEGQPVRAGQLLGRVGSTGLSTGAHLHWEMSAGGVLVDPVRFADGSNGF